MAQSTVKPRRRAAKAAALNPRRSGKVARGGSKLAARAPGVGRRGTALLGRSARGGGRLWARSKRAKWKATFAGKGAKTGAKALRRIRRGPSRARLVATGALAAAGAYFLDPRSGKHRRDVATDKMGKWLRRGKRETERKARYAEGVAAGAAAKASSSTDRAPAETRLNDPALARKVETEIFSDADSLTRGAVSVNVENGVVYLRGQLEEESEIAKLGAKAGSVEGVRQVENLLHTPGSSAPTKSDGGPGSEAA